MATFINEQSVFAALERTIQAEVDAAIERGVEAVMEQVRIETRKRLAEVALKLMSDYEVYRDQHNIHIIVKMAEVK